MKSVSSNSNDNAEEIENLIFFSFRESCDII